MKKTKKDRRKTGNDYLKLALLCYKNQQQLAEALDEFAPMMVRQHYLSRWLSSDSDRPFPAELVIPLETVLNMNGIAATRTDIDPVIYPPD